MKKWSKIYWIIVNILLLTAVIRDYSEIKPVGYAGWTTWIKNELIDICIWLIIFLVIWAIIKRIVAIVSKDKKEEIDVRTK